MPPCIAGRSALAALSLLAAVPAAAAPFSFSTGNANGLVGTLSRPGTTGQLETESADDFILGQGTRLSGGSFTGVLTGQAPSVGSVVTEIYRVFPFDSANPPSGNVPTRVNSPSDVALTTRETGTGTLSYVATVLNPSFTVGNSVQGGINKIPNQTTGGEGAATGQLVRFDFTLTTPIDLPPDHYFFIPQVEVTNGSFLWASAPRPIVAPGDPFTPDLQSWIRNEGLAPDWLRIGTDIIGQGTFNAAFSLSGETLAVPEPTSLVLLSAGLFGVAALRRRLR